MNDTPAHHFAYVTADGAAEVITRGTAFFTPDQLAGWYAFAAARDAGFGYDDETLDAHLEFIRSIGAKFDATRAIAEARKYATEFLG